MTDYPTFLARCLDCGLVVDTSSAVQHNCTTNYYNDTYGEN